MANVNVIGTTCHPCPQSDAASPHRQSSFWKRAPPCLTWADRPSYIRPTLAAGFPLPPWRG